MLRQWRRRWRWPRARYGVDRLYDRGGLGRRIRFRQVDRQAAAGAVAGTLSCYGRAAGLFPHASSTSTLKILDRGDVAPDHLRGHGPGPSATRSSCPPPSCGSPSISTATGDATWWIPSPMRWDRRRISSRRRAGCPVETWGFEVRLPSGFNAALAGRTRRSARWPSGRAMGVRRADGRAMPWGQRRAHPSGRARTGRPSWSPKLRRDLRLQRRRELCAGHCASVGPAQGGGPFVTPWPTDDRGLSRAERREFQALLTARLRCRQARRRDRHQDPGGDCGRTGQARAGKGRPGLRLRARRAPRRAVRFGGALRQGAASAVPAIPCGRWPLILRRFACPCPHAAAPPCGRPVAARPCRGFAGGRRRR